MNCNVNRQQVLSLFDTLHDKYQFKDGEYKDFVETLAGKDVVPHNDEDANPVLIHEVNEFVDTTLQLMKQKDFWDDVVDILIANTRMEDEKHEHLVWKDNGQRVTDDDEAKLLRIVRSTESLPTDLEYDCYGDWYCNNHGLLACVFWELFVPIYVDAFCEHTFPYDNGTDVYTLWKDNARRVTHSDSDRRKFEQCITDFHDQVIQEWNERKGRFAPIDPVLAEKMNHSETVKQLYGVPTD